MDHNRDHGQSSSNPSGSRYPTVTGGLHPASVPLPPSPPLPPHPAGGSADIHEIRQPPPILTNPSNRQSTYRQTSVSIGDVVLDDADSGPPLPSLPHDSPGGGGRRGAPQRNGDRPMPHRSRSILDDLVPLDNKTVREKSAGERLDPTLLTAKAERDKYAFKAKMTGYALNAAIGMQVVLGALTTGLSAATTGRQTSIMTAILGGFATIVASYLARARGSNEPELSITRVKDLEQFIRECEAFKMDNGHVFGDKHNEALETFRRRFEELLGNANGERRLAPPV